MDDNEQFDPAEQSSSPSSENESSMTPDSPTPEQGRAGGDLYQDAPQSNPARWNVSLKSWSTSEWKYYSFEGVDCSLFLPALTLRGFPVWRGFPTLRGFPALR